MKKWRKAKELLNVDVDDEELEEEDAKERVMGRFYESCQEFEPGKSILVLRSSFVHSLK